MLLRRIAMWGFLAMAGVATWRGSGEDAGNLANGAWGVIDSGAHVLTQVWQSLFD